MLKRLVILAALIATPALAQQALDPAASTCGSVASMLTTNVILLTEQLAQANAKIVDLQKQIDAAKPKDAPK